ncbi:MAG: ferrochelatase, partial [Pseudomonadota bacterium]
MNKKGVILVNLGTPSALTSSAIRTFLRRFLSDQRVVPLPKIFWQLILNLLILPFRAKKLVKQYADIWLPDGSPLEVYTQTLCQKLQQTVLGATSARPPSTVVHCAMSYSQPLLSEVIQKCIDEKYTHLTILPLYPQYASSTVGAVFDQVFKTLRGKCFIPTLTLINGYYDHPAYIETLAQSVKTHWQTHGKPQRLIMSFHGIPQNSVTKGDPYAN